MRILFSIILLLLCGSSFTQSLTQQLTAVLQALQDDEQFRHASVSMYVVDSKTGSIVFAKNPQLGMAPASTQKIITSISAYDLLGKNFTYKTIVGYDGSITGNKLNGNLYLTGSGDPTFGSWRWQQTSEAVILSKIIDAFKQKQIGQVTGRFFLNNEGWETQATPRGWTWEDIGNYYGAGASSFNWRENQYDLILAPGKLVGDAAAILSTRPALRDVKLTSELKTGAVGTGDNAIVYLPEGSTTGYIRGTIPSGVTTFTVKGAFPFPPYQFLKTLQENLGLKNIQTPQKLNGFESLESKTPPAGFNVLLTFTSPTLDSMNYWFLKKSINLYGEAFLKTIGYEKKTSGATDTGLAIIRHFWSQRGIEKSELKIIDGSGLSPANRLTTHALVTAMQYAKKQPWFASFYHALPEMNGIRMKDGYISGVRSYTGYIKSKRGEEYTFAFIVNNFDGSPGAVREKMWRVLNVLK